MKEINELKPESVLEASIHDVTFWKKGYLNVFPLTPSNAIEIKTALDTLSYPYYEKKNMYGETWYIRFQLKNLKTACPVLYNNFKELDCF